MGIAGLKLFHFGVSRRIECMVLGDGSVPAEEFLNRPWDKRRLKHRAAILAAIDLMAQTGNVRNETKFKKVEGTDGVSEFKAHQLRLFFCTLPGGIVVLLDGVIKKKDRLSRSDVDRMQEYRNAVVAWHKSRIVPRG